jgi:MraZ protein
MFKGRYLHAVDSKGRVSLPAKLREAVAAYRDDRLVLTHALDPEHDRLHVFPLPLWEEFEEKLARKPLFDRKAEQIRLLYVAPAVDCAIDGHGRILIPPALREHAGIEREAIWVGMNRILELWEPRSWEAAEAAARDRIAEVRRDLDDYDL